MSAIEPTVSVIIPCYNEEGSLHELYRRVRDEFTKLSLRAELIFIDDGSTDGTRAILREFAASDEDCRVIVFRRNSGKAAALNVGFRVARGEFILTMDADLQDDPAEIPRFLEALQRTDLVSGWKFNRLDPLGKTLPSRLFNATVRHVTGVQLHDMNCGFKGYRRQVVQEVSVYGELHRYIPALAAARGFRIEELAVTHHPRRTGVSKYGWERFTRGFFDLLTVVYITKYRTRPLHLLGNWALGSVLVGIIFGVGLSTYLNFMRPTTWHYFLWLITGSLLTIGPLLLAIGLIAEGNLASTLHNVPQPPVAERINFPAIDEVTHAG
ncbi:MAG TPA: glycosyltransferase family 2 protein [Armatimonadota bacterium]|nr:glycosyltransferase family 2 protein [Armatimonadota bacterium]